MSENTDPTIDLDDVEGHGLKEVAAGLSTAGILIASAAGVAHAAGGDGGTGASVHAGGQTISAQATTPSAPTLSAPQVAMPHVTTPHVNAPHITVPTVTVPQAHVDLRPAVASTLTAVSATEQAVHNDVVTAKATVTATEHAVQNDVVAAKATVAKVENAAQTTVSTTATTTTSTVARAETLVQTRLRTEVTQIANTYTAVVHVVTGDKGVSMDAHQATGTVTLTSGGQVIGTATVLNGLATLHWSGQHGTMTLSFGGDGGHSGATITI